MLSNKKTGFLNLPGTQSQSTPHSAPLVLERWLIKQLLIYMGKPRLRFVLWDGTAITPGAQTSPVADLHITCRKSLWRLLSNPGLNFGDDYCAGLLEVDGGLVQFMEAIYNAQRPASQESLLERYAINRPRWMHRNTVARSKQNIHHHYDLGNDFYRLWLDRELVYTCAYFPDPAASLEAAQLAKMEHVCRKLQLRPGENVVEAGCGWGSLALYMARHYGVKVTAYNISREQIAYARNRAKEEGLDDQVQFIEDDYRNIAGSYDVFVSVGMLEHVGRSNHRRFGEIIDQCLKPGGRGFLHSISQNQPRPVSQWIERRIFPGGYPPTLHEITAILQPWDFVITDVENLRAHYAKTLEHWLERFDAHTDEIWEMYDEAFVRAWRLYLSASIANFSSNTLQLYQVLFTRPAVTAVPWTRAHLYTDDPNRKPD